MGILFAVQYLTLAQEGMDKLYLPDSLINLDNIYIKGAVHNHLHWWNEI